ncbi:type IV pilus biogenesis protein PilM [Xenorhabdus bovienii]|uniref:type IV pilus biogenesis protein PilM n=1 Tax=Xenorhabdus bovienii TaxID=40576 RepID=UPI003DA4170D
MFSLNNIMIVVFLLLGGYMLDRVKTNEISSNTVAKNNISTTTFILYADSLSSFLRSNSSFSGAVTNQITLPRWLPKDENIKMYADNGRGYVYTPDRSSIYRALLTDTDNSSMIGITDKTNIITNIGAIPKPSFIPENYIVYVI